MKYYKKKIAKSKTITLQQLYGIQTDKKTTTERTKVGGNDNTIYQLKEEVRRLQEHEENL
jgi:hypothetical protein